jgi:histidine triad (HIT) family protein
MTNDCIFCAIGSGEIPSFKIYEDDDFLAYLDINPISKGHTLVIPKSHTQGLLDTSEETLGKLLATVKKVASHLKTALACDAFNILQNNGEAAGQTVFHIHFHIIPRYNGDDALSFAGSKGDMDELKKLAESIKIG